MKLIDCNQRIEIDVESYVQASDFDSYYDAQCAIEKEMERMADKIVDSTESVNFKLSEMTYHHEWDKEEDVYRCDANIVYEQSGSGDEDDISIPYSEADEYRLRKSFKSSVLEIDSIVVAFRPLSITNCYSCD